MKTKSLFGSFAGVLLFLIFMTIGCQGNPVAPDAGQSAEPSLNRSRTDNSAHQCLGYYALEIDTQNISAEIIPLRSADWHFNMTGVLNSMMGVSAAMVPGQSDPSTGLFVLDITLTHPFGTKPQFSGFDVKGILMTPGTLAIGPLIFADADETELENADGYTRWWNPTEFIQPGILGYTKGNLAFGATAALTATVNPYKMFADILEPEGALAHVTDEPLDSDRGRAVFTAGSANTRRYRIRFEMDAGPKVIYGYAIDCAWGPPSPNPPAEIPDDFPIEANQPEAYRVAVIPTASSLYCDGESGSAGGTLRLQINIHDWQGHFAGDTQSEIGTISIYAPDLMPGAVDAVFMDEIPVKARYTVDLTGVAVPTHSGETKIICQVGSTDGSNYRQTGLPAPDSTLSAFHAITIDIPDPDCGADTNNDFSEAVDLDLVNPTVDGMCAPDDYRDFFVMDLPLGNDIAGDVTLYCDPEPTKFAIYDESETLISEISTSGGTATLDLDALGVMPGTYYLRVFTQTSGEAFLYMIVPNLELTDLTPHAVNVTPDGLYFDPRRVQGYGELAIASGSSRDLWIYDYTDDKYNPEFVSYTDMIVYARPGIAYPYIYASDGYVPSSIDVVDISDPYNPIVHEDIMAASEFVVRIMADEGYLYLCTQFGPVDIVDISTDPLTPQLVGTIPCSNTVYEAAIIHDATGPECWFAYCCHSSDIRIYDISDKGSIPLPWSNDWGGTSTVWGLASIDNYLFCIVENGGIYTVYSEHVDSGGISLEDSLALAAIEPLKLEAGGSLLFAAEDTQIAKIDISDPADLKTPLIYLFPEAAIWDLDVEGDHILMAHGSAGIRYVTTSMQDCGRTIGLAEYGEMVIDDDYMFVIDSETTYAAIKSVDLSNPASAFVITDMICEHYPLFIAVEDGKMISGAADQFLEAIDCSDPANMAVQDSYNTAKWIGSIGFNGETAFAGFADESFDVFDLTSWPTISYLNSVTTSADPEAFLFRLNVMYVLAGGNILVYSINDPGSPLLLNTYIPQASAKNITIDGDYLYIATCGTLEIADISDPTNPVFISSEPHPDAPDGDYIAVENQFAILQPYQTLPPTVMRVWPPDDPTVIDTLYDAEYAVKPNQVLVHNGYYYEREPNFGLRIWDLY